MKDNSLTVLYFLVFLLALYGMYWVVKTVSYTIFYEDMVQQTIKEMVNPDALRLLGGK